MDGEKPAQEAAGGRWTLWLLLLLVPFGVGTGVGYLSSHRDAGSEVESASPTSAAKAVPASRLVSEPKFEPSVPVDELSELGYLEHLQTASLDDLRGLAIGAVQAKPNWRRLHSVFDRWIELDPAQGWEFVSNLASTHGVARLPSEYLRRWALADPEAALGIASELGEGEGARTAMFAVGSVLAERRPELFFERFSKMWECRDLIKAASHNLAAIEPERLARLVTRLEPVSMGYAVPELVATWGKQSPDAALAWVRSLVDHPPVRWTALRTLAGALISADPERAAALFRETGEIEGADGYRIDSSAFSVDRIAAQVAESGDPLAALRWLEEYFPGHERRRLESMAKEFLPQDATQVPGYIEGLPDGALNWESSSAHFPYDGWIPINLREGLAATEQIADPKRRNVAAAWLLGAAARTDPEWAVATANATFNDPAVRDPVVRKAMEYWAADDLEAASSWLADQPEDAGRDSAIVGLVSTARFAEPESALRWAEVINDGDRRASALLSLFFSWNQGESAAAKSALASADITGQERERIAEALFRRNR